MRKPIVVGFEPRERDRTPVDFAATLARMTRAPLIIASVQSGSPVVPLSAQSLEYAVAHPEVTLPPDCSDALEEIEAEVRAAQLPVDCLALRSTSAARGLHEHAEKEDAALLVVGSGRTATSLLHGAPCPVASVRGWTPGRLIATVGVAFVDGPEARLALHGAHALAGRLGATLRVIAVVPEGSRDGAEEELRSLVGELGGGVATEVDVRTGEPPDELIRAGEELDVLVCASRGYGPVRAVLLGSVTRRVVAEAACPVIAVPRGVKTALEALVTESPGAAAPA